MEEDDKGCPTIRMGVSGWMFLLVPAYPVSPGQKAVKLLCVCVRVHCVRACVWMCACVRVRVCVCVCVPSSTRVNIITQQANPVTHTNKPLACNWNFCIIDYWYRMLPTRRWKWEGDLGSDPARQCGGCIRPVPRRRPHCLCRTAESTTLFCAWKRAAYHLPGESFHIRFDARAESAA